MGGVVLIVMGVVFFLMGVVHRVDLRAGRMKPYVIRRLRPLALVPVAGLVADRGVRRRARLRRPVAGLPRRDRGGAGVLRGVAPDARAARGRATACCSTQRDRPVRVRFEEVALTETDPPEVEVRLKHGAPLPQGVHAAVHDPTRPYVSAPQLRAPAPDADRTQLTAAVEGFGGVPSGVPKGHGGFASATYHHSNGCCQSSRSRARHRGRRGDRAGPPALAAPRGLRGQLAADGVAGSTGARLPARHHDPRPRPAAAGRHGRRQAPARRRRRHADPDADRARRARVARRGPRRRRRRLPRQAVRAPGAAGPAARAAAPPAAARHGLARVGDLTLNPDTHEVRATTVRSSSRSASSSCSST